MNIQNLKDIYINGKKQNYYYAILLIIFLINGVLIWKKERKYLSSRTSGV